MKKILLSLAVILAVGGVVWGVTGAFYNDTEASTGNIFVAGSIDLKVDHSKQTYNGAPCVGNCVEIGSNLVLNGGFETPDVASGGYAIYPDASQTSWTVESGDGLEIQDNADGAPHGGNQLAELDSTNPSVISQTIVTVPGVQYRLKFWYSPRPNRPAGDNTIGAVVQVVSNNALLVNDIVGAGSAGGANTAWQELVYNFVATEATTKIKFSDLGTANSYGGYLDDVSVKALECTSSLPGGVCSLWGERDLGQGDTFFNFNDIKPADWGTNVISYHIDSNDAWMCAFIQGTDLENTLVDPEADAGDVTPGVAQGELSGMMDLFAWRDLDGDGVYEPILETALYEGSFGPSAVLPIAEPLGLPVPGNTTSFVGMQWCAGNQTVNHTTGAITCDGSGMTDQAQTDSFPATVTLYATQSRNNAGFSCASVLPPSASPFD